MGLFVKKASWDSFWRNPKGIITCRGDLCPAECDDSCPIWLNTKAIALMNSGENAAAISLYMKVVAIAPDFYGAWCNMGAIYGETERYTEAYECYMKAYELNRQKPNAVIGLALCTCDMMKPDESLSWCDEYEKLSKDGAAKNIRDRINRASGTPEETDDSEKREIVFVAASNDRVWYLCRRGDTYLFTKNGIGEQYVVKTPANNTLNTRYRPLADRILNDLEVYGTHSHLPDSVLSWHYTMIDYFNKMKQSEIVEMLEACFLTQKSDWTYCVADAELKDVFGKVSGRTPAIRAWLEKCTYMQLVAACCVGNAYHSMNVAFVFALFMENFKGDQLERQFAKLSELIASDSEYGPAAAVETDTETFRLYYGIHFGENGNIINKSVKELK